MKRSQNIIGIDLGGTKLASGKVVGSKLNDDNSVALPIDATKDVVVNLIKDEILRLKDPNTIGIGIGVPSVVDTKKGIIYDVQNIPSWKEVPLKDILEFEFGIDVRINNDANCHVLGEKFYGLAKDYSDIVAVSIGTGLGVGVISDNKLLEGSNCGAGEVGMIPYQEHNYEYYCSGQFFREAFKMRGEEVYELAEKGNGQAKMIFEYFGKHLGNALLAVVYAYDPESIIIGGSLAKARKYYEEFIRESLDSIVYQNSKSKLEVMFSELDNAAIYGAAALCYPELSSKN